MQCVSRYCAIQGRPCEKEVPDVQDRCCFIAYPFQQPFLDIASEVERNLSLQGYRMEVPRVSRLSTGLLFCDNVCPMISKSNLVLGEVTVPNHNVFFELGYASGLRKPVLLLRNTGLKSEPNSILDSGVYINHYETSQDIVTAVVSNDMAARSWSALFDDDETEVRSDTVAVLTPDHADHKLRIGGAIRQQIANHKLTVVEESGAEIDLLRKFRMIQSAEWVVGDLVSDDWVNSHALNSETAFLLGMAVSLQKKVIVLQEDPVRKPMIDLAGLLARYTGIDSLMKILAERLGVLVTRTIDRPDELLHTAISEDRDLKRILSTEDDDFDFAEWTGERVGSVATEEPEHDDDSEQEEEYEGEIDDGLVTSYPDEDVLSPEAADGELSLSSGDSDLSLEAADDSAINLETPGDGAFELVGDFELDDDEDSGSQVISLDEGDADDGDIALEAGSVLDEDDALSDSGSQVIALDDEDNLELR